MQTIEEANDRLKQREQWLEWVEQKTESLTKLKRTKNENCITMGAEPEHYSIFS